MDACNAFLTNKPAVAFPKGSVSPDLNGGLRIEWYLKNGVVRLIVPPDTTKQPYFFHRFNGQAKTEFDVSGHSISYWLIKVL